jgi:hypothetical protein
MDDNGRQQKINKDKKRLNINYLRYYADNRQPVESL